MATQPKNPAAPTPPSPPQVEGAHPSLLVDVPTLADVERVWRDYWGPMVAEGGLPRLKGELYDAHHLVNEARKVYRHVTGGLTDDLAASGEGIIALADARVEDLTRALRDEVAALQAEVEELRTRLARAGGGDRA